MDAFTKFTIIKPVRDTKAKGAVKILLNVIHLFGVPSRIVSDRGTAFTARTFKIFCTTYGIRHVLNAIATPHANGQCERYNRTIMAALAMTVAGMESNLWDDYVKQVQSAMNTSFNQGIGTTPAEALMGYKAKTMAVARILHELQTEVQRLDLNELRKQISDHITEDQRRQKERYDKTRREATRY